MQCPSCGSENVVAQVVNESNVILKPKHKSILWWVFIGWWWVAIKWVFFTGLALIVKIFRPKRYKTVNKHTKVTMWVCQNCGNTWTARRR